MRNPGTGYDAERATEEAVIKSLSIYCVFHRCWTRAVDSPDYNKKYWQELERRLIALRAFQW